MPSIKPTPPFFFFRKEKVQVATEFPKEIKCTLKLKSFSSAQKEKGLVHENFFKKELNKVCLCFQ